MRRLLLDTHTFLWWLSDDKKLGPSTKELISDPRNEVYVSAATAWEISIKKSTGKLQAPDGIDNVVEDEGFSRLSISFFHGEQAGALPAIHKDPFDRMLIAQAQAEGLEVVTVDETIPKYGIKVVNATA